MSRNDCIACGSYMRSNTGGEWCSNPYCPRSRPNTISQPPVEAPGKAREWILRGYSLPTGSHTGVQDGPTLAIREEVQVREVVGNPTEGMDAILLRGANGIIERIEREIPRNEADRDYADTVIQEFRSLKAKLNSAESRIEDMEGEVSRLREGLRQAIVEMEDQRDHMRNKPWIQSRIDIAKSVLGAGDDPEKGRAD